MSNNYDDSSISGLVGEDRIRKRPASMLGSSGVEGARHGFTEIYGNALDEISTGFGDRLDVHLYADGSVSLRDYGRGVPLGWNDNPSVRNWNWHAIYNELYAGGKYSTNQTNLAKQDWSKFNPKDYNYLFSVGLNGLGAASTQYTSEFFTVKSFRDGKVKIREFKKGRPVVNGETVNMFTMTQEEVMAIPEIIEDTAEANGTFIHWKPDIEVFDNVDIGSDWLFGVCKDIACIAGITLHYVDDISGKDITIEAGTLDNLAIERAGNHIVTNDNNEPILFKASNLTHGNIKVNNEPFIYVCQCDVSMALVSDEVESACFHNSVKMISGIQYEAVNDAISSFFKDRLKSFGVKLDRRDTEGVFSVVVSTRSNHASFRNQTKDAVDDLFIYTTIKDAILDKLNTEFGKGNKYITDMVQRVVQKAQDRQALANYVKVLEQNKKIQREKAPEKFVSCDAYEKKRYEEAELWITEGDSAKGSVKSARNKDFQAIYPIRGKGLNVLKSSLDRILKNKEIREIFSLIGTGMDVSIKGQERTFDISKLKFGKIIFATDADEDGYQIRVLLFLIFYKLAPELLRNGHIYIAETPRFRINFTDGTHVYAKDDAERDAIMESKSGCIKSIARYKGLGEVNADILRETTVHPATRNLIQLSCDLDSEIERDLIDALFGNDKYKQRKSIISTVLDCADSDLLNDDAFILESDEEDEEIEETEIMG